MKPGRIFISYSRGDDPEFVRRLRQDLLARGRATGERGLRVFFDEKDMPSRGKSFLLEIRDFIGDPETERVLLVVGPRAVESKYVQAECRAALQRCVIVVPLLRLGRPRHDDRRNARRVDDEDYGFIPAEIRETGVHAVDFRERRGARPGRSYDEALDELWRILAEPASLAGVGSDVPDLPANFLARPDHLAALGRVVLADADEAETVTGERRFVVLSGMGGVGKSVLASAFCRACKTRRSFEHGIAWVRMGSRPELPDELVDVLAASRRAARAGRLRTGLQDLSCLIVLDDVTDPAHVTPFKNAIGASGRLLITTRDSAVATALNAERCAVDLLSDAQSLQLLADWSGQDAADLPGEALDALAECGRLPLAVAMIGAMMKDKPRDRWRNVLADLRSAQLDEIRQHFPNYDHPDLLRALKVSVDGLEGRPGDPGFAWEHKVQARRRYLELAIFPGNTPLPLATLHRYWASMGVGEPLTAKLADRYVERNLARRDESGRLVLHDLQRDYIVYEQREGLRELHRRFLEAHRPAGGWSTAAEDGYLLGHLAEHLRAAGREQELNGLVSRAWMEARFAASGSHRGFADDVEAAIAAGALAGDLVALARACLVRGTVAELATGATPGFIGALARNGEVDKAIHNASLMAERSTRTYALGDVCAVLIEQGGWSTAQRVTEQLLQDLERAEGSDESDVRLRLLGFSWAASCLAQLGRPEPAAAAAARALALLDAGTPRHVRVRVLENVSRTFLHSNRRPEARRFARQALKDALPPSSNRAALLRDVALLLVELGDHAGLAKALGPLQVRGRDLPYDAGEALLLVAEAMAKAGRKKEAEALVRSARAIIPHVNDRALRPALVSSLALTVGRMGQGRQAEALARRAQASIGRPGTAHAALAILHNAAMLALALGQKARAVQLARRALKAVPADSPERLTEVGTVAQVLSEAGRRDEASALLADALAAAWVIRDPWSTRDTAGILGEALVRVGKVAEGVAQLADLGDAYGARGRAQERLAGVLAETGAWEAAASLADSTEELYRSEALRRVAGLLAGAGNRERAWKLASAIANDSTRSLCLCEIVPLDDEPAVSEARRVAERLGEAPALGILAERLAVRVSPAAGREVARQALEATGQLEHHELVVALGDLGRPFLLARDDAGVRRVEALLRKVKDREYRAYGRLRLAIALAEAGQAERARAIVEKELPGVRRLTGRDVAKASLLAAAALTLRHTGADEEALQCARQALATLDAAGGSSSSAYDNDLTRSRAVAVLARAGALQTAFAKDEVAFEDLARDAAGKGLPAVRALLAQARAQPEGAHRAEAVAWVAWALDTLGASDEARDLVGEALGSARRWGRRSVLAVVEICAGVIASIDAGDTLLRLCASIREVETWWAGREPRLR